MVIYPMFKWLSRFLIKRRFNNVRIEGKFEDNGNSVLVIANHISWWDGFWIMLLNLKVIRRKFHFMMLEEQLKKHWYFQYSGAYSIKKSTKEIVESLNYTIALLKQKENMVFMFPQGRIHSMHHHDMIFEQGVERIIENSSPEMQILFVVNLLDYLAYPKPTLYVYTRNFLARDFQQKNVSEAYNQFYKEALDIQQTKVA